MRNYFMQLLGNSLVGMFPAKDEGRAQLQRPANLLCGMFPEGRAEERSCNGPPRTIMWDVS
jgi:hypothetical protein